MKRCLTRAGSRRICLGLAALAALSWSCTKEPAFNGAGPKAEGAIAQARSFYESTATPLTKSVGEQQIPIKPLPGEITPLWDRATASVLSDGTTAWVDVPIQGTISYTAVRGGHHSHEAGQTCGHNHTPVQVVQKLTIYTAEDGTRQSLIATIVPEADCTVELNAFSSAEGLEGFSGFVSWHDLTGKLIRVAGYENGTKTKSVEATGENEAEVLEVVENAILYPASKNGNHPVTKATICNYCGEPGCKSPNDMSQHCMKCGKFKENKFPFESKCICRPKCSKCSKEIPEGKEKCPYCANTPADDPFCEICGVLNCKTDHAIYPEYPIVPPPYVVQQGMFTAILAYSLNNDQFSDLIEASYSTDLYYLDADNIHLHGLYVTGSDDDKRNAHTLMRNYFIMMAQTFVENGSYYALGKALHPIADTYVPVQTRVDMLNFYSYSTMWNIVDGSNIVPYSSDTAPCTEAIKFIYNELMKLSGTVTAEQLGNIFDRWLVMTGGGY